MHKLNMQKKGCGIMTYEEYVQENRRKLKELKKLPYETLCEMKKEILNNPNSTRADIVNIIFACGEVEIEQGIGRTYTIDEVRKKLGIEKCSIK